MSYCNSGYSMLGRLLEVVDGRGRTWDRILRERIIEPLALRHTNTLPEEALLHRAALGHPTVPGRDGPTPSRVWTLARSAGPAGLITSTGRDLLTFVRLHLDRGRGPDGTPLVSERALRRMLEPQIAIPDRWTLGDRWGLGWILFDWDGRAGFGHDGATIGQYGFLRVLPDTGTALAVLTNGVRRGGPSTSWPPRSSPRSPVWPCRRCRRRPRSRPTWNSPTTPVRTAGSTSRASSSSRTVASSR